MRNVIVVAAFSMILLAACAPAEDGVQGEALRPVRVMEVTPQEQFVNRRFSGVVAAEDELPIAFRVGGQVSEVLVTTGNTVSPGQVIARIANDEYALELERSQAALEAADSQLRSARAAYQRTRELFQNDGASRSQLESAQSSLESAESNQASAQAQLERARLQLSYTEVSAPFAGTVSVRYVDPGVVVGAGQAIVALAGAEVERVQISVPEDIVARMSVGTPVTVSVAAAGLADLPGEVATISSGTTQQGALFPVEVAMRGDVGESLRVGMAATVDVALATEGGQQYVVPSNVVLEDESGRHLFVAVGTSADGTATIERREVEVGRLTDAGLTIVSGITTGDRVVTAGMSQLRDGMSVRSPQ